ncbi:MAG TPA: hypothetical protein VE131_03840 [Terriglobales bacterium]|nr:hypothetical protein [Terriglobales bacterium]
MASQEGMTYSMPLAVYLHSAVVRGILVTNQARLSNDLLLRGGDEVFFLKQATLELFDGIPADIGSDEYLIYMQEVFLIADLSAHSRSDRSGYAHLFVKKNVNEALLSCGPYWLKGLVHLLPGAPLHDVLMAKTRFVPVTDAILLGRSPNEPRTYLVNRTKIGCITAVGEGSVES